MQSTELGVTKEEDNEEEVQTAVRNDTLSSKK